MERIINLNQTRQERQERQEQFKGAAEDLMALVEKYRETIPQDFMAFLLALAISDQAIHYTQQTNQEEVGHRFLEHLFDTAQQLFEIHLYQGEESVQRMPLKTPNHPYGQIVEFAKQSARQPE